MSISAIKFNEGLNSRIKEFRLSKDLTQKELATSLGIATSYYSDIENMRRSVSKKTLEKLNSIYNVSINWMYTGDGSMIEGDDVSKNVPFNVSNILHFEIDKEYSINDVSVTLIDQWLSSSLQILNFYCSSILGQISSSSPHNNNLKVMRDYAYKIMVFSSDLRQKLLDNRLGYNNLDINEKILLITQINTLIKESLDLIHSTISKLEFKWK